MKQIEVYAHTGNGVDPRLVKTHEDATVQQLIEAIAASHGTVNDPESWLFAESGDEPFERHRTVNQCEIRNRYHVHLSRCRKVKVSVFYNAEKTDLFPPSATIGRILKWAIKEFRLTPKDAADKILVLKGTDDDLPLDAHIGSFTSPTECAVSLCLTALVQVEG